MTKLTIQLDGKTYGISDNDQHPYFDLETLIRKYLFAGLLVELQPQEEKRDETEGKKLSDEMKRVGFGYEQSILQNLRAELERRMALYEKNESVYNAPYYAECYAIYDLINKLKEAGNGSLGNTKEGTIEHIQLLTTTANKLIERFNKQALCNK